MAVVAPLTYQQFLAEEVEGDAKREFRAGEVYAMAGAGTRHSRITPVLSNRVQIQLNEDECEYLDADTKLFVSAANAIYYPDGMIACPAHYVGNGVIDNPSVIFEVVSESSIARDWNLKLADYETIPSLFEYVLIDARKEEIAVFSRPSSRSAWTLSRAVTGSIHLEYAGIDLLFDAIYKRWRQTPID